MPVFVILAVIVAELDAVCVNVFVGVWVPVVVAVSELDAVKEGVTSAVREPVFEGVVVLVEENE